MSLDDLQNLDFEGVAQGRGMTVEELEYMAHLWVDEMYDPVEDGRILARSSMDDALLDLGINIKDRSPNAEKRRVVKRVKEMFLGSYQNGDLVLLRRAGDIVGLGLMYQIDAFKNPYFSGPYVEIGKLLVVPDERGKKIGTLIGAILINRMKERYPNLPILVCTEKLAVKKMCRAAGFKEIDMKGITQIKGTSESYERIKDDPKCANWTGFLFKGEN